MADRHANNPAPATRPVLRQRLVAAASLVGVLIAFVAVVLFINLSWFDEPLDPALSALEAPRPGSVEDNAHTAALEFLAPGHGDPSSAENAREVIEKFESLRCFTRHYLDCAQRLIAETGATDEWQPSVALLFDRYEALIGHSHFAERDEWGAGPPWPNYGTIRDVQRLRLAASYRADSTQEFLQKAARDLAFWRIVLLEGESLAAKMVALAGIQEALEFISTALRERDLTESEVAYLEQSLPPFSSEESDISEAFLAEARVAVRSEIAPVAADASWLAKLLLQRNATLNQLYRDEIVLLQQRAHLTAREFYEQGGHDPLRRELRWTPQTLYNFGGKLALSRSPWDAHEFSARVHDMSGRISLLLLQAEIERRPGADVAAVVRASRHRNPYTGEAMNYDPGRQVIEFKCLHTAFHPPEPADICAVAVTPPTTRR